MVPRRKEYLARDGNQNTTSLVVTRLNYLVVTGNRLRNSVLKIKVKSLERLDRPRGFQEVQAP